MLNLKTTVGLALSLALSAGITLGTMPDARSRAQKSLLRAEAAVARAALRMEAVIARAAAEVDLGVSARTEAGANAKLPLGGPVSFAMGGDADAQSKVRAGSESNAQAEAEAETEIEPERARGLSAGMEGQIESEAEVDAGKRGLFNGALNLSGETFAGLRPGK